MERALYVPKRARRPQKRGKAAPDRYFQSHFGRRGGRKREHRFVEALFKRINLAYPDLKKAVDAASKIITRHASREYKRNRVLREALRLLAVGSLKEAGYFMKSSVLAKNGRPKKNALHKADWLLGMPRIQAALAEKFAEHGLGMDEAVTVIADVASGKKRVKEQTLDKEGIPIELERDVTPAERLRAVDMMIRSTIGYAPTKGVGVIAHTKAPQDGFYDDEAFEKTPPIKTIEQTA